MTYFKRMVSTILLIGSSINLTGCVDDHSPNYSQKPSANPSVQLSDKSDENAYVINISTMKIHRPACSSVDKSPENNIKYYIGDYENLISSGYTPCAKCNPQDWTPNLADSSGYDYDTERIIREGHPVLLDKIGVAESFWNNDLKANAVVVRNADDAEYPYAYLILDGSAFENDSDDKQIQSVQAWFYNCNDAEMFRLENGIEIIRSYLPLDIMEESYSLRESKYQNIWIDNWESDGTKKPNFQYDYYANYELNDDSSNLPPWISVHVYLDGWGLVQGSAVCTEQYQNDSADTYEWNYDYLTNNSDYNTGKSQWDFELLIQYPRPSGYPALKKGDHGDEVGWLQTALNKAMSAGIDVDCSFGGGTDAALREFQSRCGLGADGSAGFQTITTLIDIVSGNRKMPEKIVVTDPPVVINEKPVPQETPTPAPSQTPSQSPVAPISDGYYILNTSKMKIHKPTCSAIHSMNDENKQEYWGTVEELEAQGYTTCGKCHPR